jgi:hypothetical protein
MPDLEALSERYLAAWTARDLDAIVALHTAGSVFRVHAGGEPARGKEAVRAAFADVFERFPGFAFEVDRLLLGEGHWVLDWTLVSDGDGGELRLDCLDVVVVADGLVARKDTYVDAGPPARGS